MKGASIALLIAAGSLLLAADNGDAQSTGTRQLLHQSLGTFVENDRIFLSPDGKHAAVYRDNFQITAQQRQSILNHARKDSDGSGNERGVVQELQRIIKESGKTAIVLYDGQPQFPIESVEEAAFSPDSHHFLYVCASDPEPRVVNGHSIRVREYYFVLDGRKQKETVVVGIDEKISQLQFSPDAQTWGATIRGGDKGFVMINGVEDHSGYPVSGIAFHPGGHQFAFHYLANGKNFVRHNQTSFGPYTNVGLFEFDETGEHFGFIARRGEGTNHEYVVMIDDNEKFSSRTEISSLNLSHEHYAFLARNRMHLDGKPLQRASLTIPYFSPDGNRLAYVIDESKGKRHLVVDEKEWNNGDFVMGPWFSPDSQHVAGISKVKREKKWRKVVLLDGKAQKPYDDIKHLLFSPDGKRLAYVAVENGHSLLVVNGEEHLLPKDHFCENLKFSPDSQHLAEVLQPQDRKTFTVRLDGKLLPACLRPPPAPWLNGDPLGNVEFSPDSQHIFYIVGGAKNQMAVVRDGIPGEACDRVLEAETRQWIWFDNDAARFVAVRNHQITLVSEKLP